METFVNWINTELNDRGWSRSEAARRGGFSSSTLDKVIGGYSRPGLVLCRGLARAFGISQDEVFRLAGLLPSQATPRVRARRIVYEADIGDRILALWRGLTPEDQALVLNLLERLAAVEPRIIGDDT